MLCDSGHVYRGIGFVNKSTDKCKTPNFHKDTWSATTFYLAGYMIEAVKGKLREAK